MNRLLNYLFAVCLIGYVGNVCAHQDHSNEKKTKKRSSSSLPSFKANSIETLNDNNFSEKTAKGVIVVEFYADWCGSCRLLAPIFNKVAAELEGSANFYKLNIDESRKSTHKFSIKSIPTVILLRDGKEIKRHSGYCDSSTLKDFIKTAIKL